MVGRVVAGIILVGLGLGLLGSQLPGPSERLLLGAVLLAAWGVTGLGVLAGVGPARVVGAVLTIGGIALGGVVASMASSGQAGLAAELFFTADGPNFSWFEVFLGVAAFALLSAVALLALVLGWRPRPTSDRSDPSVLPVASGHEGREG